MNKHTKPRIKISDDEPRWNNNGTEGQLSQMLNWYNYHRSSDDARKYFIDFLKQSGENTDSITKIEECSSVTISSTIGYLCRIKTVNGTDVACEYDGHIHREKVKILQVVESKPNQEESPEVPEKKVGVQQHLEKQLRELMGFLAEQVDVFVQSGMKNTFDVYDWLKQTPVKHQHAKNIADYYEKIVLSELKEAQAGLCEQLVEGYSHLSKSEMKKFIAFIETIVSDARRWVDVAKQISLNNRAPRMKKPKSPIKQVAKLKYKREDGNLKSIPPTQLVGATQLWVYNTKYRTLGVYMCSNAHGFSVKGCTILNFDATESVCKKLRKPEDVLPQVLEAGKVALRKILPGIRSKEKKLTGRINADTILLKVV